DRARQPVLAKHPLQLRAAAGIVRMRQPLGAQHEPTIAIGYRERVAALTISGAEPAFEVDTPKIVGSARHRERSWSGNRMTAAPARMSQPFAPQQFTNRARCR